MVQAFLESDLLPIRFAQQLEQQQQNFAGFNLFMGTADQAVYMSNRGEAPQVLANGVYVVSNGLMSDHWEKPDIYVHVLRKSSCLCINTKQKS